LDIGHLLFSEYPIINIQCPIIKFSNYEIQHAEWQL